jgi:hypothetical protein
MRLMRPVFRALMGVLGVLRVEFVIGGQFLGHPRNFVIFDPQLGIKLGQIAIIMRLTSGGATLWLNLQLSLMLDGGLAFGRGLFRDLSGSRVASLTFSGGGGIFREQVIRKNLAFCFAGLLAGVFR